MRQLLGWSQRHRAAVAGILAAALVIGIPTAVLLARRGGSSPPLAQQTPAPTTTPTATPTAAETATAPTATPAPAPAPTLHPTAAGCPAVPGGSPAGTIAASSPTALAFAPDGRLFFAERAGTVRVVQGGAVRTFATVATVTAEPGGGYSERGLLGLAVSPSYATDHFVYALYDTTDYTHEDVVRWTDCGGTGQSRTTLIVLPSGSDCCHKGGRLAFGPDGKLYVTLGDEHSASAAQNVHDVRGKVLRYNPDGSVPPDNPFGAGDPVWAFGLRNPFGIAFSATGALAVTTNGPSGDAGSPPSGYDLVDMVERGQGYQWPLCYGYSHPLAAAGCGGQTGPAWSSEAPPAVVPTGAAFVSAAGPSPFAGHLVFCTYSTGMLVLTPGSPHASVSAGPSGCRLDVKESPGHGLFYSDSGHIYRVG